MAGAIISNPVLDGLPQNHLRDRVPFVVECRGDVRARRAVSADSALLLEALTLWDAEIGLRLQAKWDLWHAAQARGPRPKVRCREARSREERMAFRRALRCRGHQPVCEFRP